jgi:phage shock protein C
MEKKLTRSRSHTVIAGVLGGMGTYFNIDPNILRILFVLFVIATGFFPGIFAYIIAAIFIPKETLITPSSPEQPADDHTAV